MLGSRTPPMVLMLALHLAWLALLAATLAPAARGDAATEGADAEAAADAAAAADADADAPTPTPAGSAPSPGGLDGPAPDRFRERFGLVPLEGFVIEDTTREDSEGFPAIAVHLGGVAALDWRFYDRRNTRESGLRLDRAVIRLDGEPHEGLTFRFAVDLRGTDTRFGFEEAWLAYAPPALDHLARLRVGLSRIALGVNDAMPEEDLPFVDYGFPAFLTARSDIAARVDGEVGDGLLSYDVAIALGHGFDAFGQRHGRPQASLVLQSYPLRFLDELAIGPEHYRVPLLSGLFFHFGYAHGFGWKAHLDVANTLRNKLFETERLRARSFTALHWAVGVDAGPLRLTHEVVRASLEGLRTPGGARVDLDDQITSWALTLSWMITGEPYDSRLYRQVEPGLPRAGRGRGAFPLRPLAGAPGTERGFGALEVTLRYQNADIDRRFFSLGFTAEGRSSQEFRTFEAGLWWYPLAGVRLGGHVTRTLADGRPAVFESHGRDTSVVLRLQLDF